ncbi:MAG: class I SAM-dependent rRNA methyltransferase [Nitrospiraceae bacterium]|nr:MAG: class I SAM-dependent rRNA methyltransferase [Nitrospiraceae bacterium]
MITLKILQRRSGPVKNRHPWVFSGALENIPDNLQPGTPVRLVNERDVYMASGYFNSYSQIAVRIWGHDEKEETNREFFVKRIECARETRQKYVESGETDSYRLINGENDFLPGLIVDKYGDCLVLQCHTRGIESWKENIVAALLETMKPGGIYERSDIPSRKIEGLEAQSGLLYGAVPELITIKENGFKFLVDVKHGQKTGFYLDQRDKRRALLKYAKDKTALNCFSYTGGFTVYALAGGAQKVTAVDTSSPALELAKENIRINNLDPDKCEFVCEDVKKYLKNTHDRKFDLIILDPPAFIKDRRKINEGLIGYKNINEAALSLLPEKGVLITCSCSAHLSLQDFRYMLVEAGGKTGRSVRILETYIHGIDHAELAPFLEGEYLKCFITSVL